MMTKMLSFMLGDKQMWIKEVSSTPEGLRITVVTDKNMLLDGVDVLIGEESIPLKTTVNQEYLEQKDGRVMSERTLLFDTKEEPEFLVINGMHYDKNYNKYIEIPID